MAAAFDTLKAATRLREEAGFEERQATVLVELFADRYGDRENLATRDDVAAVRGEVTMLRDDVTVMRDDLEIIVALDKLL
jgi:beta-xylosidase